MNDKTQFAPIPVTVFKDKRLTGSHLRVMALVAYFDRFGANGTGCYTGQDKMAGITGIHQSNICKILADLALWKYVSVERNPLNRRLRVYRLIYKDNPAILGKYAKYDDEGPAEDPIVGVSAKYDTPILGTPNSQVIDEQGENQPKYIRRSLINRKGREAVKRKGLQGESDSNLRAEIANRLGADGWSIILKLPSDTLKTLCDKQESDTLDDDALWKAIGNTGASVP